MTGDVDIVALTADLVRLRDAATAGPWHVRHAIEDHGGAVVCVDYTPAWGSDPLGTYGFTDANAALIVAAVNAIGDIAAGVTALAAQVEELTERACDAEQQLASALVTIATLRDMKREAEAERVALAARLAAATTITDDLASDLCDSKGWAEWAAAHPDNSMARYLAWREALP